MTKALCVLLQLLCCTVLLGCDVENSQFIFQGKPISDTYLKHILHDHWREDCRHFEWEYIGQLSNGCHVIWVDALTPDIFAVLP